MDVEEPPPQRIAQSYEVVPVSAASRAGGRLVRLTDAPIQILVIYLVMTLALPAFLLALTDFWPNYYRYEDFAGIQGIVVFGAVILACIFRHSQWANTREVAVTPRPIFIYSMQKLRIAGLILAIGVAIINTANSGFRYDDFSLSEKASLSLYAYSIIPACAKLLLIYHAFIYRGTSAMDRLERALVTAAFAASINGSGTAFVTVFCFIALQTRAGDYLFRAKIAAASYLRVTAMTAIGAVAATIVGIFLTGAYIYGESVKREVPVELVLDSFTDTWEPGLLIERMAPQYASLVNTLPLTFDFDQDSFGNLALVWNTFLFRLEALDIANFGVSRASTMGIMRINLEYISNVALSAREGTAPGLIPGFLYSFPPFLNALMLGTYVFMALGILQRLCMCMNEEMSFIGKFFLTYFTLPLFESPIDFLLIIDDGFIFFIGLWWMGRLVKQGPPTFSTPWEAHLPTKPLERFN